MSRWTETEMVEALWRHWSIYYACITQCPSADTIAGAVPHRRIDMLLLGRGPVTERVAVEIKVARGDFLDEVRRPAKREAWDDLTHRFLYAVPEGLVEPEEIPEGCGLVTVARTPGDPDHPYYQVAEVDPGTARDPGDAPAWLLPYIASRLDAAETMLAGRGVDALHRLPRGALVRRLRQTEGALQRVRARPATR